MSNLTDKEKLHVEVLKADLDAYRKLETWGSSLFLGALGLIGQQLIEWDKAAEVSKRIALDPAISIFPAAVGLAAFAFLRVVNFRSYKTGVRLRRIAGVQEGVRASLGSLGLILATMPLILGYAISWFLTKGDPSRAALMPPPWTVGALLATALVINIGARRKVLAA